MEDKPKEVSERSFHSTHVGCISLTRGGVSISLYHHPAFLFSDCSVIFPHTAFSLIEESHLYSLGIKLAMWGSICSLANCAIDANLQPSKQLRDLLNPGRQVPTFLRGKSTDFRRFLTQSQRLFLNIQAKGWWRVVEHKSLLNPNACRNEGW